MQHHAERMARLERLMRQLDDMHKQVEDVAREVADMLARSQPTARKSRSRRAGSDVAADSPKRRRLKKR